jgi:phosphate transport system substrate-binding protein
VGAPKDAGRRIACALRDLEPQQHAGARDKVAHCFSLHFRETITMSPRVAVTSFVFAFLLACIVSPTHAAAAQDALIWRGDQATGRAIMDDLAKEYAKEKKGKITLQPFSTVSGLDAVAQGSADIGGSARGKYARRAEEVNINFVPVALDAAVPITHPRNPVSSLTLKQIHDIYYGRITNWKDLGGEDKSINLYAIAAPLDGIEFSLRELVFHNGDQRVAAPRLYLNTTKLEEAVTLDPAGLGLSTLASVHANKGIKMLSVEGIAASSTTVANASYPLYITLYLASRLDSPKQAEIDRYLAFLDTPTAKDILRRHQLIPYADAGDAIALNNARVAFIDAHLGREASGSGVATLAASAPTPVSAPRASLEAKTRIAPTAESTQEARANLARAEEKKAAQMSAASAAKKEAAKKTSVAHASKESAPKKAAASPTEKTQVANATAAKPATKKANTVAKAEAPKKPATSAKPAASFGNVSGGAAGG